MRTESNTATPAPPEPPLPSAATSPATSSLNPISNNDASHPGRQSQPKSLARDIVETLVLIVVVVTISQTVLANYVIQQDSAVPNFYPNQRVFVDKVVYRFLGLNRGDVVVVHPQQGGEDLFKRVIGLPGETVDIRENHVYINNQAINEPYLAPGANSQSGISPGVLPRTLGSDEYFLMGDNRSYSADSRAFGPFSREKLVGRVWLRYWPLNTFTLVQGKSY